MSTGSTERRLLTRAEELDDTSDLAWAMLALLAGGRLARLDPTPLASLAGAAFALGAGQVRVYTAGDNGEQKIDSERLFIELLSSDEDDVEEHLEAAKKLQREARDAHDRARSDLASARQDLASARRMPVQNPCDGCHAAKAAAIEAAEREIRDCRDRLACLEEALSILDPLIRRLEHALKLIRHVPASLGATYESVYDLIRRGGQMPHDGDFITGEGRPGLRQGRIPQ